MARLSTAPKRASTLATPSAPSPARVGTITPPSPAPEMSKKQVQEALASIDTLTANQLDRLPVKELWAVYIRTKNPNLRNYFWAKYYPLVRYIAERTYSRLPDEVDVGDLMSAGQFGLRDAIDAFDLSHGVKFETYCAPRIKGAILDELRQMDWVPRLVRSRSAKVQGTTDRFKMRHGRAPTPGELSDALGVNTEEFEKITRDGKAVGTSSLNRKCFQSDGNKDLTEIDTIRDDSQSDPLVDSHRRDLKELITKGLTRAERLIVVLYYYEEMTMKEIGSTLDLSESRVSQMHSSILARLKAQMQHRERELEPAE